MPLVHQLAITIYSLHLLADSEEGELTLSDDVGMQGLLLEGGLGLWFCKCLLDCDLRIQKHF